MGIYLNKWSGELQLEIKEGCVHGTWMPPLLTNSWIFSYLIKAYFVLHKGHNSEISKVKLMEIELDLPLVILNNITKFAFDLVEWQSSYWTETINFTIWYFIKGHNFHFTIEEFPQLFSMNELGQLTPVTCGVNQRKTSLLQYDIEVCILTS